MSDTPGNILGTKDLFEAIVRVETKIDERLNSLDAKVDTRLNSLDGKVDALTSRQDRLEGRFDAIAGMLKWVGLPGLVAVIAGLLWAAGAVKLP